MVPVWRPSDRRKTMICAPPSGRARRTIIVPSWICTSATVAPAGRSARIVPNAAADLSDPPDETVSPNLLVSP